MPPHRPNVILIAIDTMRAGHLSCYGHPRKTTPNLDRFAEEGVPAGQTPFQSLPRVELIDLQNDPEEQVNCADAKQEIVAQMEAHWGYWSESPAIAM